MAVAIAPVVVAAILFAHVDVTIFLVDHGTHTIVMTVDDNDNADEEEDEEDDRTTGGRTKAAAIVAVRQMRKQYCYRL